MKELSRLTNHTSKSVAFPCYARYDLTADGSGKLVNVNLV